MKKLGAFSFDEDSLGLDDVSFGPTGNAHDFADPPAPFAVNAEMNDQVDAGGDGWYDKASADVLARQSTKGRVQSRTAQLAKLDPRVDA